LNHYLTINTWIHTSSLMVILIFRFMEPNFFFYETWNQHVRKIKLSVIFSLIRVATACKVHTYRVMPYATYLCYIGKPVWFFLNNSSQFKSTFKSDKVFISTSKIYTIRRNLGKILIMKTLKTKTSATKITSTSAPMLLLVSTNKPVSPITIINYYQVIKNYVSLLSDSINDSVSN